LLSHVAKYSDIEIDNNRHNKILNKSTRIAAWAQVLAVVLSLMFLVWLIRKMRRKRA